MIAIVINIGTLCIDLHSVRASYMLLLSTETMEPSIMITLGRATLHLAGKLRNDFIHKM